MQHYMQRMDLFALKYANPKMLTSLTLLIKFIIKSNVRVIKVAKVMTNLLFLILFTSMLNIQDPAAFLF